MLRKTAHDVNDLSKPSSQNRVHIKKKNKKNSTSYVIEMNECIIHFARQKLVKGFLLNCINFIVQLRNNRFWKSKISLNKWGDGSGTIEDVLIFNSFEPLYLCNKC